MTITMTNLSEHITTGVDIPSKWDIIPIHNSDRGSFKRCRRYWDWSSPARQNLTVRADVHGINTDLWFGTGIHWALEQYYNPLLKRDPVEAFKTWFDIQWRGGVVTDEWLNRVYDLKPKLKTGATQTNNYEQLWIVRGLEDILPDPNHEEFDELFELGIKMMEFYKNYAARNDDFEVLICEHDFSVPIWDYENQCILTAVDVRENSPNYGKTLEVHARGRMDALKVNIANEKLGIIDHKTAAAIGEDYFEKLEMDEQCSSYLWAAQIEAKYYGLSHAGTPLEEVLYNVMRKAYPKPPTELKNGMFSISRQSESTTYEILTEWMARNMPGVPLNEKQQEYVNYLRDVGDEQFVIRKHVRRNQAQLHNVGYRIYLEALDMLGNPSIYPNITNDWLCRKCQFRLPCLATEDGADAKQILKDNYSTNKDR